MVKFFFNQSTMRFGETLKTKRKAAKLSQKELAKRAKVDGYIYSDAYISNLERGYDKTKKGEPIRPDKDLVIAIAKVLDWDEIDALTLSGHAAGNGLVISKPKNIIEFLNALESLGIEQFQFRANRENLENYTEDEYQELLERIQSDISITLKRKR